MMTSLKSLFKARRGQVFIMATLIIVIYVVSMLTIISLFAQSQYRPHTDVSSLNEIYETILRETKDEMKSVLSLMTKSSPSFTEGDARTEFYRFIDNLTAYCSSQLFSLNYELNSMVTNGTDMSQMLNITEYRNYETSMLFNASIKLSSIITDASLSSSISLQYCVIVRVEGDCVFLFREYEQLIPIEGASIYSILANGTSIETVDIGNGKYHFSNFYFTQGIVNATLINGISIYSHD